MDLAPRARCWELAQSHPGDVPVDVQMLSLLLGSPHVAAFLGQAHNHGATPLRAARSPQICAAAERLATVSE